MYKIGDEVRVVRISHPRDFDNVNRGKEYYLGKTFKIDNNSAHDSPYLYHLSDTGQSDWCDDELELKNKNMDIKEKFSLLMTKEPYKSFRRTGITNGDNILTDDGVKVFLSYLLEKHDEEFKKDVVDDLLNEMKNEKK